MNDKQIECFIQAAMLRNFRAAGEALYISQPAVSHHIRMLEEELGFPLFRREHQHIELTVAGRSFFRDCVYIKGTADLIVQWCPNMLK